MLELNLMYGPLGEAVWERILCMIYQSKDGYYYEFKSIDNVAIMLVKSVGNKWISKEKAIEIIRYLVECGLLDTCLISKNVMTSKGIQKRWSDTMLAMKRKKFVGEKHWIIRNVVLNDEKNDINSEETIFNYEVTYINSDFTATKEKEIKINKKLESKLNEIKISVCHFEEIVLAYFDCFNKILSHSEISNLLGLLEEYGLEKTKSGVRESVFSKEKESISYLTGIMKNTF